MLIPRKTNYLYMTIAKDFASKAAIAFVALAMIFSMFAPSAKAQSSEDLQTMINTLLAQIAALQAQVGQGGQGVAVGICPFTWTRDLKIGATGADVMKLQQSLNSDVDTRVAASGAGSVGAETSYFGPATAAAVSKFQVKYRSEILTPAGLVNPTGFFGPSTRAKMNFICATPVVTPGDDTDEDEDEDEDSDELSGEASLFNMEIDSASDDEVEEGSEDAEIAEVTVEFKDGDASISRLDVSIVDGDLSTDPWDVLDTVSLWVDGDMVAEMDAADESDYTDEDLGTLRFSGLDIVGMEDEEVEITIAATFKDGIDTADLDTYEVSVDTMRFFDADDVATTEDSGEDFEVAVSFTIVEAGADDEIIVKTSSSDIDGTTLQVEDDSKSDFLSVFIFDLDTDDSVNDIELKEVTVNVAFSGDDFADVFDDAELVIDGVTIDSFTASTVSATSSNLVFDVDGDVTIDAGDRVAAELKLRFKALAVEGTTVTASVSSALADAIEAEGADDLTTAQISGSATGDAHTLRTAGMNVAVESVDADVTVGDNATDDYATYVIEVEVTAFEQDVYISTNPATSTSYVLENGASVTATTGTRSVTLTSTGDEVGGTFEITEGSTETITLTVTYTPGVAQTAARMQLNSLTFGSTSGTPTGQTWTASPEEDYRTAVVTMVN